MIQPPPVLTLNMASVFDLLDQVRSRPSMYVGGNDSQGLVQLHNLEQLLGGYAIALRQHNVQERVADFPREFGEYLWRTRGWSAACGPVAAICNVAATGDEAWQLFWKLVDEFRASLDAPKQPRLR